ncbi:MAG: Uma2 family endonuclease [Chitinophagaceae bacterium]|nr:Uma2 family endonuclease [Chitinophagaceae bacterium]
MSSAVKILPHYTYEDWIRWEGQWELIEGIPYAMSPAPVPAHQNIAGNIFSEFKAALKKSGCKCKAYMPIDYVIAEDAIVQPDVLIVCGEIKKKFLDFPPSLVTEILSPGTALKDRNNKFTLYEAQKIPYYIIVDIDKKEIEIYTPGSEGKYTPEKFSPHSPYRFQLTADYFIEVVLNNIWE